jgi:hypothetical protein
LSDEGVPAGWAGHTRVVDWDGLVGEITARYPEIRPSSTFGMSCLERDTGKVMACEPA